MPNLPAPYVSPWKDLARNLRALWADLGLRARELWRRNREGDLSVPAFWPSDLATLFWPLVLAFSFALLVSAGVQLNALRSSSNAETPPRSSQGEAPQITSEVTLSKQVKEAPALPTPVRELPAREMPPSAEPDPLFETQESKAPVALLLDPLLDLFLDGSAPEGVLKEARPEPADNRLVLRVTEAWWQLEERQRSDLANAWQERSSGLGYTELQLLNGNDRLLARSARVGDGMILFNNVPPA